MHLQTFRPVEKVEKGFDRKHMFGVIYATSKKLNCSRFIQTVRNYDGGVFGVALYQ